MRDLNDLHELHQALQRLVARRLVYALRFHDDILYKAWLYVTPTEAQSAISLDDLRTLHDLDERQAYAKAN